MKTMEAENNTDMNLEELKSICNSYFLLDTMQNEPSYKSQFHSMQLF